MIQCYQHCRIELKKCSITKASRMESIYIIQAVMFTFVLVLVSFIDIKSKIIPDRINLAVLIISFIPFEPTRILGILSCIPFFIAALTCGGIGGGDIKLMAVCGMVLGLKSGILAMVIGLISMIVFYGFYKLIKLIQKRKCQKAFPYAPFLSIGCLVVYYGKIFLMFN